MTQRLIELALKALEAQKATIETEIRAIRAGIRAGLNAFETANRPIREKSDRTSRRLVTAKKPKRTAESKTAQSKKMKAYWARRKTEEAANTKTATGYRKKKNPPAKKKAGSVKK